MIIHTLYISNSTSYMSYVTSLVKLKDDNKNVYYREEFLYNFFLADC